MMSLSNQQTKPTDTKTHKSAIDINKLKQDKLKQEAYYSKTNDETLRLLEKQKQEREKARKALAEKIKNKENTAKLEEVKPTTNATSLGFPGMTQTKSTLTPIDLKPEEKVAQTIRVINKPVKAKTDEVAKNIQDSIEKLAYTLQFDPKAISASSIKKYRQGKNKSLELESRFDPIVHSLTRFYIISIVVLVILITFISIVFL